MLTAGLTCCSFLLDGGPPAPQDEINSLVEDALDIVEGDDGVRKKAETDVVMVSTDAIASENFMVGLCTLFLCCDFMFSDVK